MVICFECSRQTKSELDELVASGNFSNLSEAIAVAVANQLLLSKNSDVPLVVASQRSSVGDQPTGRIPAIFAAVSIERPNPVAPFPVRGSSSKRGPISQAEWIFGQHNKLLPAKASCRALANLLTRAPTGIDVEQAARDIANHAADLGTYLQHIDVKFGRVRDDVLSTAFPGRSAPDKGRIRYANQFVAGITKQGQLTGLLVDLGLVNKLDADSRRIALTEAGWAFAQMPNPVLDGGGQNPESKFSSEEKQFLADHIAASIPAERSAFQQILAAIHGGHDNPEKLRVAFGKFEKETASNKLYFATQRAGAMSRMADLGLVRRNRDGTRVKYSITDDGAVFLNRTE